MSTKRFNEIWGKKIIAWGIGSLFSCQGSDGNTGTFTSADGKDITVVGGIVTGID
jgi:hypothetical protein